MCGRTCCGFALAGVVFGWQRQQQCRVQPQQCWCQRSRLRQVSLVCVEGGEDLRWQLEWVCLFLRLRRPVGV